MKFLNENSMSRVLINKLVESKDLKEDAWDDNFVISVIQDDGVYWKRKSDGKEIKTSFDVFKEPTDPTEWKSEEELSQYALEEDLGPAQKVYNKRVLNNKKKVNTAKNSATNLNEETEEKRIAKYGESGGSILRGGWKEMSNEEAENLAKEASIENPDDVFYVEYNDLMNSSSDIRWYKGESYTPEEIQDIRRKEKEAIYKDKMAK